MEESPLGKKASRRPRVFVTSVHSLYHQLVMMDPVGYSTIPCDLSVRFLFVLFFTCTSRAVISLELGPTLPKTYSYKFVKGFL